MRSLQSRTSWPRGLASKVRSHWSAISMLPLTDLKGQQEKLEYGQKWNFTSSGKGDKKNKRKEKPECIILTFE